MKTENIEMCINEAGSIVQGKRFFHEASKELTELKRLAEVGERCEQISPGFYALMVKENAQDPKERNLTERQTIALERIADSLGKGDLPHALGIK